jgi:RNA polymerase sigma-70 factor (ECF subfamily)
MTPDPPRRDAFPTTRITLIRAASEEGTGAHEALSLLCSAYWYPVYAYIRRLGHPREDAEDLTQAFFARVVEKRSFRHFQSARGRFRSYLLGALKHFIANEHDRSVAQKRGGDDGVIPLEGVLRTAEDRYSLEARDTLTPERLFERQWALELLARVEARLSEEALRAGKQEQFARLKPRLLASEGDEGYRVLAADLHTSVGAIKVAVHRWRQRFRELLRDEISHTVVDPGDVGRELRDLMSALRPDRTGGL